MKNILLFALFGILLSSCSTTLTPFSQRIYEKYNWNDDQLRQIQFYLSDDIVLQRSLGSNETKIQEGRIKIIDGREVEEVVFKKGTPGVFVFSPKENRFGVSFEEDDSSYLMFGPNPKIGERYVLLAKEWNRDTGKVTYKDRTYRTTRNSAYATLMVDLNKAEQNRYKSKTVSGRRVN